MSKWFNVPVTITVQVKVQDTDSPETARELARTLLDKRIKECTWGLGNPWTASVLSGDRYTFIGEPEDDTPDFDEYPPDDEEEDEDGDEPD